MIKTPCIGSGQFATKNVALITVALLLFSVVAARMKKILIASSLLAATAGMPALACRNTDSSNLLHFFRPSDGEIIAGFGVKVSPILQGTRFHVGVDYATAVGSPVRAAADGKVLVAAESIAHGKYVILRHVKGFETTYAQLSEIGVRKGDCINGGDFIGSTGSTRSGPHLHFELRKFSRFVDPLGYIYERKPKQ